MHQEVRQLGGKVAQVQLVELNQLQKVVELGAAIVERVAQLVLLLHRDNLNMVDLPPVHVAEHIRAGLGEALPNKENAIDCAVLEQQLGGFLS